MHERQAREALLLQQKGAEWLMRAAVDEAGPDTAIRALIEGAKLERLVRGEATERTERKTTTDERLETLSNVELDHLIGVITETVDGEGPPRPE